MSQERSIAMANIPIYNDTDYALTDAMTQDILRDAQEHFGDVIRAIRVQSGLQRHALNVRTCEVRYAFSPQDFGVAPPLPPASESPRSRRRPSHSGAEPEGESLPASFEEAEAQERRSASLESLDAGREEAEEDDVFRLDAPVEDMDEDDEAELLDQEDEEDE
jgi:hypothetical protein